MNKHPDGSVTLSKVELQALQKVLGAYGSAISSMPSGEDFLGWNHCHASGMLMNKLAGEERELSWYLGGKSSQGKTVDRWLEEYASEEDNEGE